MSQEIEAYDIRKSYSQNFDLVPLPLDLPLDPLPGNWNLAGVPLSSPLGVAAGPLLNGAWCEYYASLGFDWVTYKSVRSQARDSYPLPNLQPLALESSLHQGGRSVVATNEASQSWAVSFGMPSKDPEFWRRDIEVTRGRLPDRVRLSVSVVGTAHEGQSLEELADDYALCAHWAVESGADFIEANLSCPNVCSRDGQLYQDAADSALVAERIQSRCGSIPLLLKIGFVPNDSDAEALVASLAGRCSALVMTNGIAAYVESGTGEKMFAGHQRGVAGEAIREASLEQVRRFARVIKSKSSELEIVGVGGIFSADHAKRFLDAGASSVQLATAPMLDPMCGIKIRQQW